MLNYNLTDQHIHQLAQTIAKFNRTYAVHKADDSHTNLAFDEIGSRLMGRWVTSPQGRIIMSLNLLNFTLEFIDTHWEVCHTFAIEGKTQQEVERSIEAVLPEFDLNPEGFIKPLHFEIPHYPFREEPIKRIGEASIHEWSKVRSFANDACLWVLNHLQLSGEIRIWPHHFDTGIYAEINENIGLGFGLSMKDLLMRQPYIYYAAYGLNGYSVDYKSFKNLQIGKWVIDKEWTGAALEGIDFNRQQMLRFIDEVTQCYAAHC